MSRTPLDPRVRLFGIRHHGPGSARSLLSALNAWQPEVLLVEGSVELESVLPWLNQDGIQMPIALLSYAVDKPEWAHYFPLAEFSPEYQAFRWALARDVPIRMIDLPSSAQLGLEVDRERDEVSPMELMAQAAGFDDAEDWWEHLVEHSAIDSDDPHAIFSTIQALMTAMRDGDVSEEEASPTSEDGRLAMDWNRFNLVREAHMRRSIRQALAEPYTRIAVICGAWHTPALATFPAAKADDALLKGLPKMKVGTTMVPWSFERLATRSGYGAGARSPKFYDLVWSTPPTELATRWLLLVAHLMREEDLDASPASVIEAIRLADALAAIRNRTTPGLRELVESARSVLIRDPAVELLIERRLIVGEQLGHVPETVPVTPLQADLFALQKRLRMKVDDTDRKLELDLRQDTDRERSELLHQLRLLNVHWGSPETTGRKLGTFHEHWRIRWRPELSLPLVDAGRYGSTVRSAAAAKAKKLAEASQTLAEISRLVPLVFVSQLDDAIPVVVNRLLALSATAADVKDLAAALTPLSEIARYGNARGTSADQIVPILDAIFIRFALGIAAACVGVDDETAQSLKDALTEVTRLVSLFEDEDKSSLWAETLDKIAGLVGGHPLLLGKATRLRFDQNQVDGAHLAERLQAMTSSGATALESAAFIEGLLDGPGAVLLHQTSLFAAIDDWLTGLKPEAFTDALPLIRRTFATFSAPERRQLAERVAGGGGLLASNTGVELNNERAQKVVPVIRTILGLPGLEVQA